MKKSLKISGAVLAVALVLCLSPGAYSFWGKSDNEVSREDAIKKAYIACRAMEWPFTDVIVENDGKEWLIKTSPSFNGKVGIMRISKKTGEIVYKKLEDERKVFF